MITRENGPTVQQSCLKTSRTGTGDESRIKRDETGRDVERDVGKCVSARRLLFFLSRSELLQSIDSARSAKFDASPLSE